MIIKYLKEFIFLKKVHYWIDLGLWASIGVISILATVFDWNILDIEKVSFDSVSIIVSISIACLPMIIQILSIILSFSGEPILGVEVTWYREKRGKYWYSYLGMIFISMIIMLLMLIFVSMKAVKIIYGLATISVCYSIIFVLQEIPFLLRYEKSYLNLIYKVYKNGAIGNQINTILLNMVSKYGFNNTSVFMETGIINNDIDTIDNKSISILIDIIIEHLKKVSLNSNLIYEIYDQDKLYDEV